MKEQTLLDLLSHCTWSSPEPFGELFQKMRREFHSRTMRLTKISRARQTPDTEPFEMHLEDLDRNVVHVVPYSLSRNFLLMPGFVTITVSETKRFEYKQPVRPFLLLSVAQVSIDPT